MRRSTKLFIVLVPVVLIAGAGLVYLDHVLSRPDRIAATKAVKEEMVRVSDQILRFEEEHWRLPRTLDELMPEYVRSDQLSDADGSLYLYDPEERKLVQRRGCLIRGLISRRRSPAGVALPPLVPTVDERRRAEFDWVFAQVQRYEDAHGSLPMTLKALVPAVSREQLVRWGRPAYLYDPVKRVLVQKVPENGPSGLKPMRAEIPVRDLTVSTEGAPRHSVALAPKGPALPEAPEGAIVWEAEHFSEMNWGWEVHLAPSASGGAYLHSWEGMTNGPAQQEYRVFDFWNLRPKEDYTRLVYHVHVPKTGRYQLYGLMWTTDTHCSNALNVGLDEDSVDYTSMGNRTPFRWVWTRKSPGRRTLKQGDHFITVFIHEDGIRLDQFMLSPVEVDGGRAYRPNVLTGTGTAWQKKPGPAFHVSFDLNSQIISPTSTPECSVVLRRLRPGTGKATLRASLREGPSGDREVRLAEHNVDLAALPEVCFVPLSFDALERDLMYRREYLLVVELVVGEKVIATNRVALLRPWLWEACGPYPYYDNDASGPLDGVAALSKGSRFAWKPIEEKHMDHFGVLDFGLWSTGNSLNAPQNKTVYARTQIMVPETATYLFLIQTDDAMRMWLDGREVYRFDTNGWNGYYPVTRSARRRRIRLSAGAHELRIRVNQTHTRWQAAVRIRTKTDDLSHVIGLPGPEATPPQ